MERKTIREIVLPLKEGLSDRPSVTLSDSVAHAIELMAENNLTTIAVVLNGRPVGRVRLEDALRHLGLRIPPPK
jgi:CBS domain-containing protein